MNKRIIYFAATFIAFFILASCQKEIDIDLNSADPKIVIEANLNENECVVRISKTVNFDEPNTFPAVSNATVKIKDNAGNAETIVETNVGVYTSNTFIGVVGRIYTLEVIAEGKTYSAVCKIQKPVNIDSAKIEKAPFGDDVNMLNVYFTDIAGEKNYYRVLQYVNGAFVPDDVPIGDDRLQDGKQLQFPIFRDPEGEPLETGDIIDVYLQNIDFPVYEYFRTLAMVGGGGNSATPTNPISNISNGALGYFNACAVRSKQIVVQ